MKIVKPQKLRPGATIGIAAPASPMKQPGDLERGIRYLESLGYRTVTGAAVHERYGYLAGRDEQRAEDLNAMFRRKDIDAIFCVRGGYGSPRILNMIDYEAISRNPKIFVGYSDISALQLAIFKKTRLVTFSGPMVAIEFAGEVDARTEAHFWRMLTDANPAGTLPPLEGEAYQMAVPGEAEGPLLGGCLSLVSGLCGSPYQPDLDGKIFIFEDVGEKLYQVDHSLAQLKNAGALEGVTGVIVGDLLESAPDHPQDSLALQEILQDYFADKGIPVLYNFNYGHGKVKYTIPIGTMVRLRSESNQVEFLEGAVADMPVQEISLG